MPVTTTQTPADRVIPTDNKFKRASEVEIPPFNWIPPEALPLVETAHQRVFDTSLDFCKALLAKGVEHQPGDEQLAPANGKKQLQNLPHPFSDFAHLEPGEPHSSSLKNKAAFQRLELAFNFIVCKTSSLMERINDEARVWYKDQQLSQDPYRNARDAYINFVLNVDNHEPEDSDVPGVIARNLEVGLGYGRNYRWMLIDPIITPVEISEIVTGEKVWPLITGATIVLKWNPHSSSSGIPIKH